MRQDLIDIFAAGVARADPYAAVRGAVAGMARPDRIAALGKAGIAMAGAALERFPDTPCLVVTNPENARDLPGARVIAGGHPVPDAGSLAAGDALLGFVAGMAPGARCLALISGGGSALAAAPAEGVTLADKATVSALLLGAGLDIGAVNLVRQGLSRIKGGGLARAAAPGAVDALILSDVMGDDLRVVASGPTLAPIGSRAEARALLESCGLWDRLPASCRAALDRAGLGPVPKGTASAVGTNRLSAEAMLVAAPGAWLDPVPLTGDVARAAARVAAAVPEAAGTVLWGGETTVVLRGTGRGGRNQELALRVAVALAGLGRPWAFLAGGTDGRDGPTEAAGAVVDGGTLARIAAAELDVAQVLSRNDSHAALVASGDLLVTGATGTNVADLSILRVR